MDPVLMLDPGGRVVPVAPEEIEGARMGGLVPASPEQIADYQRAAAFEAKYGTPGQAAIAGLESAASALTLGASTAIERALGVPTEDIAGREEANPVASGVGTALGIAAPLVLTAGASAPASAAAAGARTAAKYTAPALIAKAGRGVTTAVAGALPETTSVAGQIAARAAALGAGSAVEGAAYGLGEVVHEAALGDVDITAQYVAAEVGTMALLGGALGGLLGAAEVAVPAAGRAVKSGAADLLRRVGRGAEDAFAAGAGAAKPGGRQMFEFMLEHRQEILGAEKTVAGTADAIAASSPETAAWMVKNLPAIQDFEKSFRGITEILSRSTPENAAKILAQRADIITDQAAMAALKKSQVDVVQSAHDAIEKALRETNKVHRPAEIRALSQARQAQQAAPDEYLYHVTPESNAAAIRREGLRPDAPKIAEGGPHADTRAVFLADEQTAAVYRDLYGGGDEGIAVFRVPKAAVRDLEEDAASEGVAYLTRQGVPPSALEVETAQGWTSVAGDSGAKLGAVRKRFLQIHDRLASVADEVADKSALYVGGTEAELRELRATAWNLYKEAKTPEAAFAALTDVRRALDELSGWGKEVGPAAKRSAAIARSLRGEIKEALEDPALWGAGAARTAEYHAAESAYFQARAELRGSLMRKVKGTTSPTYVAKPETVNSWINLSADGRGQAKTTIFQQYLDAGQALAAQMVKSGNVEGAALAARLGEIAATTAKIQRHGAATQTIKAMQGHEILSSGPAVPIEREIAMGAAKAVLPGAVTGAVKGTIAAVTNPARTISVLAALERMAQSTARSIDAGASMLVRGSVRASRVGRAEVMAGVSRSFGADLDHATRTFERRVREIQALAQDPDQMHKALLLQNEALEEHAPDTAQALSVASSRAVAFLASKAPKAPERGPLAPKWQPSQAEIAKFNRYYEAVQNPTSILKQASAGTLTPEAVEAVATVYPELYARVQTAIVEKLTQHTAPVPYPSRLMAGMILGQDLDGTAGLTGKHRATFAGPSGKPSGMVPQTNATPSAASKITLSTRSLTPQQRAAQR